MIVEYTFVHVSKRIGRVYVRAWCLLGLLPLLVLVRPVAARWVEVD